MLRSPKVEYKFVPYSDRVPAKNIPKPKDKVLPTQQSGPEATKTSSPKKEENSKASGQKPCGQTTQSSSFELNCF